MLYIDYKLPGDVKVNTICWHTGEPKPDLHKSQVLVVQADGDELMFVYRSFCQNFGSIPWPSPARTVVIWREPWAGFIVDNL